MTNRAPIYINHDIRSFNGRYIQMPGWFSGEPDTVWGNLRIPNPCANSSIGDVNQLYPIGTKFVDFERTFFYGFVNDVGTANKANIGMFNKNEQDTCTWGATAGIKGDEVVGILASTLDVDTTPAVDFFAGGWFMPRTNPYGSYRVLASTTETGGRTSGEVDLTLDRGLIEAVTASVASCFLNRNEYKKLSQQWGLGLYYATCPGVTLVDPIASTWQWVQSWGPCYVVPMNEEIGAVNQAHQCYFHIDGSVTLITVSPTQSNQIAGYMLPSSGSSTSSTWLIKLQVDR